MTQMDVEICITSVRHAGEQGGVILYGKTDAQRKYAARLTWRHVPDASFVDTGQRWRVRGPAGIVSLARYDGSGTREDVQIEAEEAELVWPSGKNLQDWIAKSQQCRGIGPAKARALYEALGPELVTNIEQRCLPALMDAGRLTEVQADALCHAFAQFHIGSTLLWLDRFRIPRSIGNKVIRYWGADASSRIEEDPYALVSFEADWRQVDELARSRFHVALDDPRRLQSALIETLYNVQDLGHTCLPISAAHAALKRLLKDDGLVTMALEAQNPDTSGYVTVGEFFQSSGMHVIESYLAERFLSLVQGVNESGQPSLFALGEWDPVRAADVIAEYEAETRITLNAEQRQAVELAAREHLSLVIGPAGTGKTTVLNALRRLICSLYPTAGIYQVAPTGLAAQRMTLATNAEATTIHWFLCNVTTEGIGLGSVVIIDEASMLDVLLAYRLFRHLPEGVRVIMVGDPGQLPPVGPGLILHVLAESPLIPQIRLTKVLRQHESTGIPVVANQVRQGLVPDLPDYEGIGSGVSFAECSPAGLTDRVLALYQDLKGGSHYEVQALSPVRNGSGSVKEINVAMHETYRRDDPKATYFDTMYGEVWATTGAKIHLKERDKVMFTRNDYPLGLRNGSLGFIEEVMHGTLPDSPLLRANFEGKRVDIAAKDLEHLTHAYGITFHKSQGSQFKRVIVVLKRSRVLTREALYTALTRGVEQVVLVGSRQDLKEALLTPPTSKGRHTLLGELMCGS